MWLLYKWPLLSDPGNTRIYLRTFLRVELLYVIFNRIVTIGRQIECNCGQRRPTSRMACPIFYDNVFVIAGQFHAKQVAGNSVDPSWEVGTVLLSVCGPSMVIGTVAIQESHPAIASKPQNVR